MILDRLDQAGRYAAMGALFARAFGFLKQTDLAALPLGRHEIDRDNIYVIVARDRGRTREQAKLEAHRRYADIQVVLAGTDEMGWKSRPLCTKPDSGYDRDKDIEFFADEPDAWVAVGPGSFVVFFPDDAHAPLVGNGEIRKVIVKVAVGAS